MICGFPDDFLDLEDSVSASQYLDPTSGHPTDQVRVKIKRESDHDISNSAETSPETTKTVRPVAQEIDVPISRSVKLSRITNLPTELPTSSSVPREFLSNLSKTSDLRTSQREEPFQEGSQLDSTQDGRRDTHEDDQGDTRRNGQTPQDRDCHRDLHRSGRRDAGRDDHRADHGLGHETNHHNPRTIEICRIYGAIDPLILEREGSFCPTPARSCHKHAGWRLTVKEQLCHKEEELVSHTCFICWGRVSNSLSLKVQLEPLVHAQIII